MKKHGLRFGGDNPGTSVDGHRRRGSDCYPITAKDRSMDIVVTVPKTFRFEGSPHRGLLAWCDEGDCAGEPWSGQIWCYTTWGARPDISPGERVYIVCEDMLRGYAPLVEMIFDPRSGPAGYISLLRGGGAVAVTIDETIRGFRGWRRRWWPYYRERPFPDWKGAAERHDPLSLFDRLRHDR